jgi:hypothetical protein
MRMASTILNVSAGDSLSSLTSTATATSSYGDITGSAVMPDKVSDKFNFSNPTVGIIQKFEIAKTPFNEGYATYR